MKRMEFGKGIVSKYKTKVSTWESETAIITVSHHTGEFDLTVGIEEAKLLFKKYVTVVLEIEDGEKEK